MNVLLRRKHVYSQIDKYRAGVALCTPKQNINPHVNYGKPRLLVVWHYHSVVSR